MRGLRGWKWIPNPWFRAAHLAVIAVIAIQGWFGIICPLTTLEMHLRDKAGDATYGGTFIAHWLGQLVFFDAPLWDFALGYTFFALAVIGSWMKFRRKAASTA